MAGKSTDSPRFVLILAGGRGERFWPLSREKSPKPLLALVGKKSLIQQTFDRARTLAPPKNIFVITQESQVAAMSKQLPALPKANIVAEPCGRDTAVAIALGAALAGSRAATAVIAVLPADHVIPDQGTKAFTRILMDSMDLASRGQAIVTVGIKPTEPATSYGYIQVGETLPPPRSCKPYRTAFHRAERFVEKPQLDRAVEFLNSGVHRWNAGLFVFSFPTIVESLLKHQKELHAACERWFRIAAQPTKLRAALARDYPALRRVSFDYAVMEHAQNVVVADGDFPWDDLGSWPALARHMKADPAGNCVEADAVLVDAARNLILDMRKGPRRQLVAVVGLRDCVIVHTDDTTLVAHKKAAQQVRELVAQLAANKAHASLL